MSLVYYNIRLNKQINRKKWINKNENKKRSQSNESIVKACIYKTFTKTWIINLTQSSKLTLQLLLLRDKKIAFWLYIIEDFECDSRGLF